MLEEFSPRQFFLKMYLPYFDMFAQGFTPWSPDGKAFTYVAADAAFVQEASDHAPSGIKAPSRLRAGSSFASRRSEGDLSVGRQTRSTVTPPLFGGTGTGDGEVGAIGVPSGGLVGFALWLAGTRPDGLARRGVSLESDWCRDPESR